MEVLPVTIMIKNKVIKPMTTLIDSKPMLTSSNIVFLQMAFISVSSFIMGE
ncbi:hypothetical protein ACVLD2_004093 [Paenibacillus sp. PvR052]|nr:hypothetical protein [Paenibacillus sp. PvP091]MBP1170645.1 hypothetical protein [Paenibacillus sp. PvR098]MBP2441673.1 hypothetical protein [Paenibacillus sp. PvP052]